MGHGFGDVEAPTGQRHGSGEVSSSDSEHLAANTPSRCRTQAPAWRKVSGRTPRHPFQSIPQAAQVLPTAMQPHLHQHSMVSYPPGKTYTRIVNKNPLTVPTLLQLSLGMDPEFFSFLCHLHECPLIWLGYLSPPNLRLKYDLRHWRWAS